MLNFSLQKIISVALLSLFLSVVSLPPSYANPNSSTCKKAKTSIKKLDDNNLANWRKFDVKRDVMGNLNFSNSDYKKTLALLKSIHQADLNIYNVAIKNIQCYATTEASYIRNSYDGTIQKLADLNKIISAGNQNSDAKFLSMRETVWLWIAGEYINYYTLDGRKF
jgi:hypothetical protein